MLALNILSAVSLFLWLIRSLRAVFFHVYLWQLKEYRFDRFIDHLKLQKNRRAIFTWLVLARYFLLFIFLIVYPGLLPIPKKIIEFLPYLIPLIFSLEIIQGLYEILKHKFKRPKFTKKALGLIFLTLFVQITPIIILASWISLNYYAGWSVLIAYLVLIFLIPFLSSLLLPFEVVFLIVVFKPITFLIKKYYFKTARQKINACKNLIVIGITGSFGKTTTKEFLYTILSKKFKVLKTDQHNNTEIGVAQTILKKLKPEHQIFIAEMGAYKKGEIKAICHIVQPQIGILTGINEQHLSLFGSIENIKKAKSELIESLPPNGLAVFNGDNEHCRQMYDQTKIKKILFSTRHRADVYADQIIIEPKKISFLLYHAENCRKVEADLNGAQNIPNILAAASAALQIGMTLEEIDSAIKDLRPMAKTMQLFETESGRIIIDDTYNANPDGVLAALDYLNIFSADNKKIIVMPSLLELGSSSASAHKRLGQKIGAVCDLAVFLDDEHLNNLAEGIEENKSSKTKIIIANNHQKIIEELNKINEKTVILFVSRGAEKVIKQLT